MNKLLSVLFLVMFNYCQSFGASAADGPEERPLTMFGAGRVYVVGTCHLLSLEGQAAALREALKLLAQSNPHVVTERGAQEVDQAALRYASENLSLEQFASELNMSSTVLTKRWSDTWPTVLHNLPPDIRDKLFKLENGDPNLPMCSSLHPRAFTEILHMMGASSPSMDSEVAAMLSLSPPQGLETASDMLAELLTTKGDTLSDRDAYQEEVQLFTTTNFSQGIENDQELPEEVRACHQEFFNFGARFPWLQIPLCDESESVASRNTKWREPLVSYLENARQQNRPLVVVVGAGHLPGPTGMLSWLSSLGQNAEPPQSVMQLWTNGEWRPLAIPQDTSKLPDTASDQDKQYLANLINGSEDHES